MKVLITAGPTQEPIDDVRYITNASSGKFGVALAVEALKRGHEVTLIHGQVTLQLPDCKKIGVRTAGEMLKAVTDELKGGYDVFMPTAAVADYVPAKADGKIRSGGDLTLKLQPTKKIIDEVRAAYPNLFIVGFKAEYGSSKDELKAKAKEFLRLKHLNMLVANDIKKNVFGSDETEIVLATPDSIKEFEKMSKEELAKVIWKEIELNGELKG